MYILSSHKIIKGQKIPGQAQSQSITVCKLCTPLTIFIFPSSCLFFLIT